MKPLHDCRLYTFVDSAYLRGRAPADVCRALCQGGSDLIQLRAKDWPPEKIAETARILRAVTREAGVYLVINDFPEIAQQVGADFCHLGQEDLFESGRQYASEFLGMLLGISTHSPDQARLAMRAEPAYIAIGPIYPTGTKPTAKPVTLEYARWAAENVSIPWFAIGGVNLRTLDAVLEAGARRICVVSAILNADDIAHECAKYAARLRNPGF